MTTTPYTRGAAEGQTPERYGIEVECNAAGDCRLTLHRGEAVSVHAIPAAAATSLLALVSCGHRLEVIDGRLAVFLPEEYQPTASHTPGPQEAQRSRHSPGVLGAAEQLAACLTTEPAPTPKRHAFLPAVARVTFGASDTALLDASWVQDGRQRCVAMGVPRDVARHLEQALADGAQALVVGDELVFLVPGAVFPMPWRFPVGPAPQPLR